MLSVGKLAAGPDAGRYYEDAVALGREDYYAGEGERPGRWVGGGADRLALSGEVDEGQTGRLLSGEHPASGELLGAPMREGSVAGFDLTFNAPKSVGLAFAIGDQWTARVLRECHGRAVDDALGYLEREACRARRGKDGVSVIRGAGFAGAAFDHRTSRAGDPLLHTHVVVANRTLGEDGRWTALDGRPIYKHAKTAGYLYQARLRHEVATRMGARWGPVRNGAADLHGFSRELVEHFSTRRREIVAQMDLYGAHSTLAGNIAALETRKRKDYGVPMERLREEWRARAAEHGLTQQRIEYLLTPRFRDRAVPGEVSLDELTRRRSTFTKRDVIEAVCKVHPDGAGSVAEIEAKAETVLASPEVVRIADPAGTRYTTETQLALERNLLVGVKQRQSNQAAIAHPEATQAALAERALSDEQATAVCRLTGDGRGVEVLLAPAGAGKTFALDAARHAWQASGFGVVGCALSAQAARELREQAGIDTTTIAQLKHRLAHGYRLREGGVLIVDEAGMVGTRDLAELEVWTLQTKTKLVLVGDDRQLPEIDAGGAFRAIAQRIGPIELTEVRRQEQAWDRDALRALRDGKPADWAEAYVDHACVKTAETAPAVREQLVSDWSQAAERGADARMIALRNADVADLNQRARTRMRDSGRLAGPDVDFDGKPFATGDEVVVKHNDRHLGVLNGDRGTVTQATQDHVSVTVDRGDEVWLPRTFVSDGHLDHGYATTAHKTQGSTVDEAFVLGSQEAYREWGYTALSRHRDRATYYLAAPKPFINQEPDRSLTGPEQLKLIVENNLDQSRGHDLATDLADRYGAQPNRDAREPDQAVHDRSEIEPERDQWGPNDPAIERRGQTQADAAIEIRPEYGRGRDDRPPSEAQRAATREALDQARQERDRHPDHEPHRTVEPDRLREPGAGAPEQIAADPAQHHLTEQQHSHSRDDPHEPSDVQPDLTREAIDQPRQEHDLEPAPDVDRRIELDRLPDIDAEPFELTDELQHEIDSLLPDLHEDHEPTEEQRAAARETLDDPSYLPDLNAPPPERPVGPDLGPDLDIGMDFGP